MSSPGRAPPVAHRPVGCDALQHVSAGGGSLLPSMLLISSLCSACHPSCSQCVASPQQIAARRANAPIQHVLLDSFVAACRKKLIGGPRRAAYSAHGTMRLAWSWLACAIAARAAHLTPAQRDAFFEDGFVVLGKLLDEADVAAIEVEYDRFMSGIHAEEMGKDFTDMSKPFPARRLISGVWLTVVCCRTATHPPLRNNAWERLAAEIAAEVFPGVEMVQVPRGVSLSTHPSFTGRFAGLRPAPRQAPWQGRRRLRDAPGHGVLAAGVLTANDTRTVTLTLGHRRRNGRERLHSLRAGEPEGKEAPAAPPAA